MIAASHGSDTSHAAARPRAIHVRTRPTSTTVRPSTSTTRAATTTTTARTSTTVAPTTTPTTTARTNHSPATPPSTATAPLLVTRIAGIGGAQQVVVVATNGASSSTATVTAYERGATGWTQVFGPWFSYIGRGGVAPAGAKREGDGRTPSGVFGFDFMFGVDANPGVRFAFRRITGPNIVWDDDPASANYNEWVDDTTASAGASPEPMDTTPSYLYGAVIAYNDTRTPGLGSGIFLHVSHGSPTHGCVSLSEGELLDVLRWLDPARSPRIAIGTVASLTSG